MRRGVGEPPQRHAAERRARRTAALGAQGRRRAKPAAPNSSPTISASRSPNRAIDRADQAALHDHRADADARQREADRALVPAVAVASCRARRCWAALACARLPRKLTLASPSNSGCERSSTQRAERIGAPPGERRAPLGRQRFRQDETAVERVGEAQARPRSRTAGADRYRRQGRRAPGRARSRRRRRRRACRSARRAARAASRRRCRHRRWRDARRA